MIFELTYQAPGTRPGLGVVYFGGNETFGYRGGWYRHGHRHGLPLICYEEGVKLGFPPRDLKVQVEPEPFEGAAHFVFVNSYPDEEISDPVDVAFLEVGGVSIEDIYDHLFEAADEAGCVPEGYFRVLP